MSEFQNTRFAILRKQKEEQFGFRVQPARENGVSFHAVEGYLPTLHKLADVVENGHAYKAGLRNNDRLIEINGQDVKSKTVIDCAKFVQLSGDILALKVIRLFENNSENLPASLETLDTEFTTDLNAENERAEIDISNLLRANCCLYTTRDDFNEPSIEQCFNILKPNCLNPESTVLHPTFNTLINEPLTEDKMIEILNDQNSPANQLTPYVVDSLKRYHILKDIIDCLSESSDKVDQQHQIIIDFLTKRMLLVQTLETISHDSQRFLCNFIRKNDLPIPFTYRLWDSTKQTMLYRINFNCLMETLCITDLRLLLQFGSPSASGLGKSSLLGYMSDDKRQESFFTDSTDSTWRSGCTDVLFSNKFVIFDIHGEIFDKKLLRTIQLYSSVQIIYLTEQDLQSDFIEKNLTFNLSTIAVIFDTNYDNSSKTNDLIKKFKLKYEHLEHIHWTSAPKLNNQTNIVQRIKKQRNKNLRDTFRNLFEQINSKTTSFRSCFQIQHSFLKTSVLRGIEPIFAIEQELDRLFSHLTDTTENLRLVTPVIYQHSHIDDNQLTMMRKDFSKHAIPINDYHRFTIDLLTQRSYIELLIVEIYLKTWRTEYVRRLSDEQESLREQTWAQLRKLRQAELKKPKSTETREISEQYERLYEQLKQINSRLMNIDLTIGLFCDELFALWDNISTTYSVQEKDKLQIQFELVATKLAELVYKGFALHILRNRPLQSASRLLKMCLSKLNLGQSLSILTVIGEQSSAKSSLLNSTFGCNFRVSAGRCTIGLYLGLAYYKNQTIIILDSEGLMSLEESNSIFDNQMVTMAILSSNLVIVNHKGEISSNLENLIGMSLYAKIQLQSAPFTPKLLFVLRDQTQRDTRIFQQQLGQLKGNIQKNGELLRLSVDDELEMKHITLMPSAFNEIMNDTYDIQQTCRTEIFAREILKLRSTVYQALEEQQIQIERRKCDLYLYSKLIMNWKSIDDLGEGLLQCKSLYELSVHNELKHVAESIILDQQNLVQKSGSKLIRKIVAKYQYETDQLLVHDTIENILRIGEQEIQELIDRQLIEAEQIYSEQTQQAYFSKTKSQWKAIEDNLKQMKAYLLSQLETSALQSILNHNRDYYRQELFQSEQNIKELNKRVEQIKYELHESLQLYKKNKDDIIKIVLGVYKTVTGRRNSNIRRQITFNLCPKLDSNKYLNSIQEFQPLIDKYLKRYLEQIGRYRSLTNIADFESQTLYSLMTPIQTITQDDRNILQWFNNSSDTNRNQQIFEYVFKELFKRICLRFDHEELNLSYSDPNFMISLIEMLDNEIQSGRLDMNYIDRPPFIRDLILLILYLLIEKTYQRFENRTQDLFNETTNDLCEIQQNIIDQINNQERNDNIAQLFRRLLGKELIREIGRINQQRLIEDIHCKLYQNNLTDATTLARCMYSQCFQIKEFDPQILLKYILEPIDFSYEVSQEIVKNLCQQLMNSYLNDMKSTMTICMIQMKDVILQDRCDDAHKLHKKIIRHIRAIIPDFQSSNRIEIEAKIDDPEKFKRFFSELEFEEGEVDSFLTEQLAEVEENLRRLIDDLFSSLISRSIGCKARCPGCGVKCELPIQLDIEKPHHHYSQYHLPMAFNGWPRDRKLHAHLSMCYQQWTNKVLYRGGDDDDMSSPKEFFTLEAATWLNDVKEKSENGEACSEYYPLEAHRRVWMTVKPPLLKHFELIDAETYHTGIYPMDITSVPSDYEVLWN